MVPFFIPVFAKIQIQPDIKLALKSLRKLCFSYAIIMEEPTYCELLSKAIDNIFRETERVAPAFFALL